MNVYVVLYKSYDDAYVVGVYKSYERAMEIASANPDYYVDDSVLWEE